MAGLNTSKEPKARVRVATASSRTGRAASRLAADSLATMIAAPPSPGEQNMYRVSGSLTMSAAAMTSSDIASRRQAFSLRAPFR